MLNVGRHASNGIRVLVWRTNGGSCGRKVMLCPARTSLRKFSLRQVCFYNFHGLGEIEKRKKGEKVINHAAIAQCSGMPHFPARLSTEKVFLVALTLRSFNPAGAPGNIMEFFTR